MHKSFSHFSQASFLAGLLIAASLASQVGAEDKPAPGTLSGTVTTSDGKPAASAAIFFFGADPISQDGGRRDGKGSRSTDFARQPIELAKGVLKGKVTTDANGKYEIKTLNSGSYTYRAGNPATIGMKSSTATVEAGKTVTLDIQLDAPVKK